jgi:hypothetical protein
MLRSGESWSCQPASTGRTPAAAVQDPMTTATAVEKTIGLPEYQIRFMSFAKHFSVLRLV